MKLKKQLMLGLIGASTVFVMSFTPTHNPLTHSTSNYEMVTDTGVSPEVLSEAFGIMIGNDLGNGAGVNPEDMDFEAFGAELKKALAGEASDFDMQSASMAIQSEMAKISQAKQKGEKANVDPKLSGALGFMVGTNLKPMWGDRVKADILARGLKASMTGGKASMSAQQAQEIIQQATELQQAQLAAEALEKEKPWFEENKKKNPKIVELDNGIQYEILKKADGRIPKASDKVKVHYHGTLTNGDVFDSSVERGTPATFGVTQVIKGWQDILQLMPVGSKWKVYIPSGLAYGSQGRPGIPANSILIFEIELLDIEKSAADKKAEAKAKEDAWFAENLKKNPKLQVLESGIQYEILKEGTGATPKSSDKVKTHYHGTLIDGTVFDSSVDRGEPISFPVMGVIQGWQQVLQKMKVGAKWRVYIPFELAYGPRATGRIPAYSTLVFEIELLDIETQ